MPSEDSIKEQIEKTNKFLFMILEELKSISRSLKNLDDRRRLK